MTKENNTFSKLSLQNKTPFEVPQVLMETFLLYQRKFLLFKSVLFC